MSRILFRWGVVLIVFFGLPLFLHGNLFFESLGELTLFLFLLLDSLHLLIVLSLGEFLLAALQIPVTSAPNEIVNLLLFTLEPFSADVVVLTNLLEPLLLLPLPPQTYPLLLFYSGHKMNPIRTYTF